MRYYGNRQTFQPGTTRFIFATGIECSYPVISGPDGRDLRRDQLEETGHYRHWRQDLELVRELGLHFLRYGPPYYRIHTAPGKFDWSFTDEVMAEMRRMRIAPILDLCHFGVPDWIGNFQNPDYPRHFAEYAGAFARRYPWVWCYTPVNEMYITAEFSAARGWWNERQKSHQAFVTAMKHLARACVEAMLAIIEARRDAIFVLAESSEHTDARWPDAAEEAEFYNERRFLSLDLVSGRRINIGMYQYLHDNGMSEEEYLFFLQRDLREHFIMGHDYYQTNEYMLSDDGERTQREEVVGYYATARTYHGRYAQPIMLTETNGRGEDSERWLWLIWAHVQRLRHDGLPVCGMTWYSLIDQIDWDTALRESNRRPYPVGLFDLDRRIRPVGRTYKEIARRWGHLPMIPNGPLTLVGEWGIAADQE